MPSRLFVIAVAAALGFLPSAARADDVKCDFFVSTLPYIASAQGHYCLTGNLSTAMTSGAAITIDANSVVLDLKGYKLGGLSAGPATIADGISVHIHSNVIVRNGLIRGFWKGVDFVGGPDNNNNIVENVVLDSNTAYGIVFGGAGVNNTIRNCTVSSTGGTTQGTLTGGIHIESTPAFVLDSTVVNTFAAVGGQVRTGISVFDGYVVNNQVFGDLSSAPSETCLAMGASVVYKDNIVSDCVTSYSGGIPVPATNYP